MAAGDERHQDLVDDRLLPHDALRDFLAKLARRVPQRRPLVLIDGGAWSSPVLTGRAAGGGASSRKIEPSRAPAAASDTLSSSTSKPRSLIT